MAQTLPSQNSQAILPPASTDPAAHLYRAELAFYRKPARLVAGFFLALGMIVGGVIANRFFFMITIGWMSGGSRLLRAVLLEMFTSLFSPTIWAIVWLTWWSVRREHRLGRADGLYLSLLGSRELWRAKFWPLATTFFYVLTPVDLITSAVQHAVYIYVYRTTSYFFTWPYWLSAQAPSILLHSLVPCFGLPLVVYYLMQRWPRLAREGLFVAPAALVILVVQWITSAILNQLLFFLPFFWTSEHSHLSLAWHLVVSMAVVFGSAVAIWPLARRAVPRFRELFNSETGRG